MQRRVTAHLEATTNGPTSVVLSVAVATTYADVAETLTVTLDGQPLAWTELVEGTTRLHRIDGIASGRLVVDYEATVEGTGEVVVATDLDPITYTRPSRYADSDTLAPTAMAAFGGLSGKDLLDAVSSWVGQQLEYVSGSSRPTDGATNTYLMRQGVCRDYAHLVIALLRARGVPARLVSVYAPGLDPMDFHAVTEALVDGQWCAVDATALAPRSTLLRIATGRDASDTSFLTTLSGGLVLDSIEVTAVVDPELPGDDIDQLASLA
jgi:transglutaminase-like putative cysteine protease